MSSTKCSGKTPAWLMLLHLQFLAAVVVFAHHSDVFFGVFMLFLGLTAATREYQDNLKLREGLLVGFFLAGVVTLGSLQAYWRMPLLGRLDGATLSIGAVSTMPTWRTWVPWCRASEPI